MKVDIISGFLGAGKTTLIKRLLESDLRNEKIAIIENEFGEVSIDGATLKKYGINIKEINSGCICCSLTKDFKESIKRIMEFYKPDRIIVEPSGVAKLSDIIKSCKEVNEVIINSLITVIDALNFESYLENFDEFYKDQIKYAKTIIINNRKSSCHKELERCIAKRIREINKNAKVITSSLNEIDMNSLIYETCNKGDNEVKNKGIQRPKTIGHLNKIHHGACHHNDKEFDSFGVETNRIFNISNLKNIFETKIKKGEYGNILRAKGMIEVNDGKWIEFHYTPGFFNIYPSSKQNIGKIVVIGCHIEKNNLKILFS